MYSFEMMWKSTLEKIQKKAKYATMILILIILYFIKLTSKKNFLIEKDSSSLYNNIDESFKIIEKFNKDKFEIWY